MPIPRFHIPGPWPESRVPFHEKASHHAMRVLRMRNGDRAEIFDGRGGRASGTLDFSSGKTLFNLERRLHDTAESPIRLTLLQAFVTQEKLDWIVEKAVEEGAAEIALFPAARCVTRLAGETLSKKLQKLRDVAGSAGEECGRSVRPEITAFESFRAMLSGVRAEAKGILAPSAESGIQLGSARSAAFAVGPEGGFTEEEIAEAEAAGWTAGLLGPRILRTETAGLVALACANAVSGDYGMTGSKEGASRAASQGSGGRRL